MSHQFKKLTLHYAYLNLERDDVVKICEDIEPEIRKYMKNNYPEHYNSFYGISEENRPNHTLEDTENTSDGSDIELEVVRKNKNADVKKLYRKIAEKTHPDKIGNNSQAHVFSEAVDAYNSDNIAKILEIAGTLNIEVTNLSEESLSLLKNNIDTLNNEIQEKKQTTAWAWYNAGNDEEKKKTIIQFILKFKGIEIE